LTKLLAHIRNNAVGYLALFVALSGTGYAAVLRPGSVGTKELRGGAVTGPKIANGSITPPKFDNRTIGGSVRHWAFVNQNGSVIGGSRKVHVSEPGGNPPYFVSWGDHFSHSCAVLANSPGAEGNAPIADTLGIHVNEPGTGHGTTTVWVWPSSNGTIINARFYIAVIC
jgi:hypothetical protein